MLIALGCGVAVAILGAIADFLDDNGAKVLAFFFSAPAVVAGVGCLASFLLAVFRFLT